MNATNDTGFFGDQQQAADAHRQAYNAAFDELGLNWHWDRVTYACLPGAGREGLRRYIEQEHPHLLRAYEADFLVEAIETAKRRCLEVTVNNRVRVQIAPAPAALRQAA
ncbi:MAG TPA: hypothetical protein VKD22_05990 [Ramlibacter sp.]|nr:hypothetical protein [Ramlibacter sp.]